MNGQQRQVDAAVARAKAGEALSEALDMADNGWAGPEDARVLAAEVRKLRAMEQRAQEMRDGEGWSWEESCAARHVLGEPIGR